MNTCAACWRLLGQRAAAAPHAALRLEYAEPAEVGHPHAAVRRYFKCRTCQGRLLCPGGPGNWRLLPPGADSI